MKKNLLFMIMATLMFASCNQASFSNQAKKKGGEAATPTDTTQNCNKNDANAAGCDAVSKDVPKEVDCTAMVTQDCQKLRDEEKADDSFRTVDCSSKDIQSCEKSFNEEKDKNKEGSEMRVINCKPELEAQCKKLQDDFNDTLDNKDITDTSTSTNTGTDPTGDITEGDGSMVREFKIDSTLPFDGQTTACLFFKVGRLDITFGGSRFDLSRLRFVVKRGTKEDVVDGSKPGSYQIPNWTPACSAAPTPKPSYRVVNQGERLRTNPPVIQITSTSEKACIYVDDAIDGRPGAIVLTDFDFHLNYKCK